MIDSWPIVGIARATPEAHGAAHVWILETGTTDPCDCGSVYTPAPLGANWYGYRVVSRREWRRALRAARCNQQEAHE
jgi:hypothetical protein